MKRLILLLLLMIPVISFSQDSINKNRFYYEFDEASKKFFELGDTIEIFKLNADSSEITFNGIRYLRVPKNKIMYSNKELKYITQAMVEIQYRGWCKELCVEPTFEGFIAWKNKYNKY